MSQSSNDYRLVCEKLAQWIERPPACAPAWPPDTWQRFIEGCRVHGVASLLYVRRDEMLSWPSHIMAWIDDQYAQNRRRIKRMIEELSAILDIFERHGVRAMPLKGLVVTELAYDDIALRPMNDLDLLLAQSDFEREKACWPNWVTRKFRRMEAHQVLETGKQADRGLRLRASRQPSSCRNPFALRGEDPRGAHRSHRAGLDNRQGRATDGATGLAHEQRCALGIPSDPRHPPYAAQQFPQIQLIDLLRLRSVAEIPAGLLNSVDARATIAPLVLLQRYFPCRETEVLLRNQRERITASFAAWAESLDLYTVSYLNPAPWRD